jgi:transcriptional pleiotropic regulator of transition state genes
MKSTGIVRKLDELGRVVLPVELRRRLGIDIKDTLELKVDGGYVILEKYKPKCMFCKSTEDLTQKLGKQICSNCLKEIAKL